MDASMSIDIREKSKTSTSVHNDQRGVHEGVHVAIDSDYLGGAHGRVHGCVHGRVHGCVHVRCAS